MKIKILGMLLILLTMLVLPGQVEADGSLEVEQNEIYAGEVFSLYFYGFKPVTSTIRFVNASSEPAEAKFSIIGESDNRIFLRISKVTSSRDKNRFVIEVKNTTDGRDISSQPITVVGRQELPVTTIKFDVTTVCSVDGKDNLAPIRSSGYLYKESDKSNMLMGYGTSKETGFLNVTYTTSNIRPGETFVIQQEPIGGMVLDPVKFTVPDPVPDVINLGRFYFKYPNCPVGAPGTQIGGPLPSPSPTPSSTLLPTPSPTPSRTTIKVNATVLCGVNEKLTRSIVYMKREYGGAVVTSAEIYGKGSFEYSGPSAISGQRFILQATELPDEIPYVEPGPYPIVVPYPPPAEMEVSAFFSSPYCPGMFPLPFSSPEPNITGDTAFYYASPIPTPTPEPQSIGTTEPQGGLPQPTESPASQQTELTQVTLSNYADFSFDPADQGSSTTNILNPETPRKITWTLSTISSSRTIYVREIYSDGTYQEFQYDNLGNGQVVYAGNLEINIKLIKRAVKITIGDKEIDISNPDFPLWLHLPGTEGQGQQFRIPVVITYSDGSSLYTALTFNYNPPVQPPSAPTPCPYQEEPQNCPYGGIRECSGTLQNGICKYDSAVDPNCRETCNPAPPSAGGGSGNTCVYTESFNCTGQNGGCGSGSGEMRKTIINTDCRESSITYCDGACALSGGGGSGASCPESYPECRGANTFWITPECDGDGNIIKYDREDLGDLGQC